MQLYCDTPIRKLSQEKNRKRKKEDYHIINHSQTELKTAIKQQKNTAIGEDTLHPQMKKKTTTRDTV